MERPVNLVKQGDKLYYYQNQQLELRILASNLKAKLKSM